MLSFVDESRADLDCLEDVDKEGTLDEGRLPAQHSLEGLHVCTTPHIQSVDRHIAEMQSRSTHQDCIRQSTVVLLKCSMNTDLEWQSKDLYPVFCLPQTLDMLVDKSW